MPSLTEWPTPGTGYQIAWFLQSQSTSSRMELILPSPSTWTSTPMDMGHNGNKITVKDSASLL